jgi:toxin-antitoxin system PIN domain toxin
MKLLDANILIYAVNVDAPLHKAAKSWIEEVLSGTETVAFSWIVILAFLRLSTRPGLFRNPLTPHEAFYVIHSWLDHPDVAIINPGPNHFVALERILEPLGTAGNLTSDAHLAAMALENGAELCSCDADFARFAGLKWRNPLKPPQVRLKSK